MSATRTDCPAERAAARPLHFRRPMKLSLRLAFASLALMFAAAGAACDSIDRSIDCHKICDRWKECADSNYDASSCASRCEDKAGDDDDYDKKADTCESCLEDKSCGESIGCAGSCLGIVP
jgi:hypothetical protein